MYFLDNLLAKYNMKYEKNTSQIKIVSSKILSSKIISNISCNLNCPDFTSFSKTCIAFNDKFKCCSKRALIKPQLLFKIEV